jgi:hypothetical protein
MAGPFAIATGQREGPITAWSRGWPTVNTRNYTSIEKGKQRTIAALLRTFGRNDERPRVLRGPPADFFRTLLRSVKQMTELAIYPTYGAPPA